MHTFHLAKVDGLVGDGVCEAFRATIPAIVKTNEVIETCIANEYISAGLGRFLGLPLAPGAVVQIAPNSNVFGYACLQFTLANESLPDVEPRLVVQKMPRLATGLVVLDILIANPDRHPSNLSALVHGDTPRLLIFDHGHALLGYDRAESINRLSSLEDRLGISGGSVTGQHRHCLLDFLEDETWFQDWIPRIRSLPDHLIDDLTRDMRDMNFITDIEALRLKQFLLRRRDRMPNLISAHRHEFKGIKQWGLPLW